MARSSESLSPGPADEARRERFAQVFDTHFRAVSAYALRRTTPAEAEDVVAGRT